MQYYLLCEDFFVRDKCVIQSHLQLFLGCLLCLCKLWWDCIVIDRYVGILTFRFVYLMMLPTVLMKCWITTCQKALPNPAISTYFSSAWQHVETCRSATPWSSLWVLLFYCTRKSLVESSIKSLHWSSHWSLQRLVETSCWVVDVCDVRVKDCNWEFSKCLATTINGPVFLRSVRSSLWSFSGLIDWTLKH